MLAFRSRLRLWPRATALLLASIVSLGALGHAGWDDPLCDPIPVHHDANAHRFRSGRLPGTPADDHCALCHSMRSLRAGLVATPVAAPVSHDLELLRPADRALAGRVFDSTAASRAPPAVNL
jgi:hypothetical protein